MSKAILSGSDALHKLLDGVNLISNAVKASLGPSGRNVIYERLQTNLPVSSRDGVTIAEQIEATDPFEAIGVNLLKGVAREAVDQSGDGTTTATLLAQAIFAEGVKAITVGANPVALKRGIEKATAAVLAALRGMAVPVSGDMLRSVATISANNDAFLGGLIAESIAKAGPDGVVTVEVSQSPESSLQIVEGLQIGTGFISPNFITNAERNECVLEDCSIYLHESKLAAVTPMADLLKELARTKKSFLVIAEDVTDEALDVLAIASKNTNPQFMTLPSCAVRTPGTIEHLRDIAALTGARVHTDLLGVKLQHVGLDFLGHAKKVIVKANSTTIVTEEKTPQLEKRLQELRTQVSEASDEGQRLRLQSRLARLAGGVAVIKVGAATELEMNERKDRIEDALHATRCAEKEGVLPGGGVALLRCSKVPTPDWSDDERSGALIVSKACQAQLRTLAENCGESAEYILKRVSLAPAMFNMSRVDNEELAETLRKQTPGVMVAYEPPELMAENFAENVNFGWNARTGEYGDMIEMGILDPLRVVRVALESAASVAALMLITHTLVSNERK